LFQPLVKLKEPSWFHLPPLACWLTLTVPSLVPAALKMTKGAAAARLVPAVHQASMVLVASLGR
jgi:hypothetical protein